MRSHDAALLGLLLASALLVSGCGSQGTVPVVDIGQDRTSGAKYHRVIRGETLYSIAFNYGFDYRELAAANNIEPPYTIFIDQKIDISGAGRTVKQSGPRERPRKPVAKPPESTPSGSGDDRVKWSWPLSGEVIKPFSLSGDLNKGIDIAGRMGDPVKAAADGVVVYAGGNLRGYGKLVIIKHNDLYLSAYGNNQEVLVQEGEHIRRGQTVARVGQSASQVEMLHFEVRLNGKPRDPIGILPSREGSSD
ncbi:MAG: peptidoglycan DD-metalloendopeptidase family protein [Proteobacteria bacterium]|jgi:lipoprotein NlpD|nr:peptidoglycan DD-metalloendopeptidase family protein [Pseudomonadota bacterium]MDA1300525.1 peptidoglycan DD-metalloendopeptidase family protein [Pseudomonadota bacterium]